MKPSTALLSASFFGMICMALWSCESPNARQTAKANSDYLLMFEDSLTGQQGYRDQQGEVVIPLGKYTLCITDTFAHHAVVLTQRGFAVIDRTQKVLYKVFTYDNGPDYTSDGLFRIVEGGKIGYADAATYEVVIRPQFDCAYPFENGLARVSNDCRTEQSGEHSSWESEHWQNIDKQGNVVK